MERTKIVAIQLRGGTLITGISQVGRANNEVEIGKEYLYKNINQVLIKEPFYPVAKFFIYPKGTQQHQ